MEIAMANEQFILCTGTLRDCELVGSVVSTGTNVRSTFFSAARVCRTASVCGSCGAEKAGAPCLKMPALCHAMLSNVGPS